MSGKNESKVLIILGMHRSGTSLTANWLNDCGLNLGDDMMIGNKFNPHGHFEDWDFLNIHNEFINRKNLPFFIGEKDDFKVDDDFTNFAKTIVNKKNEMHEQWGWKDPRTCLFINEWGTLIPDAKILVVYRNPDTCVDSIIRRESKKQARKVIQKYRLPFFNKKVASHYLKKMYNNTAIINRYFESWLYHNKCIVEFLETKNENDTYTFESTELTEKATNIFDTIHNNWNFDLTYSNIDSIVDPALMKNKSEVNIKGVNPELRKACEQMMQKLNSFQLVKSNT